MILLVQYTKIAFITFFSFFLIMHYQRVVIVLKANASGILTKKTFILKQTNRIYTIVD